MGKKVLKFHSASVGEIYRFVRWPAHGTLQYTWYASNVIVPWFLQFWLWVEVSQVDLWVFHSVRQASSSTMSFFIVLAASEMDWMGWFTSGVVCRFASRGVWVDLLAGGCSQLWQIWQGDLLLGAINTTCWHTSTTLVLFRSNWRWKPRFGMKFLTLVGSWNWIDHISKVWSVLCWMIDLTSHCTITKLMHVA